MPHEFAGHYKAKHPEGTPTDPRIAEALGQKAKDGRVSCAAAHRIARELNEPPEKVGQNIDLLELRIHKCQLGLFGYGKEADKVQPAARIEPSLEKEIQAALEDGHRLSCASAWQIASKLGCKRREVAAACEALQLKITACQIGAF